eukprot:PITA_16252
MEDTYRNGDSNASKSTDSSPGNDASVHGDFSEKNYICDSEGLFRKVQTKQFGVGVHTDDIVQSVRRTGLIGVVIKVADDSDSDSDSDEDKSEDESIPEDCARIFWTNFSESTEKADELEVIDRVIFHGDIVATASDPSGQRGIVVNVDVTVDLLTRTSVNAIRNVSCRDLQRIRAFMPGDYVIQGPWVGRVGEVVDNVTVLFDDGSKCEVMNAEPDRLIPIPDYLSDPYFPGQRVRGSSSAVFENARWLCGTWKKSNKEGTVGNVVVGLVSVDWIAAANPDCNSLTPAVKQDPKELQLLSCFSYVYWQLGDWCLLPASERRMLEVTMPATDDTVAHKKDNALFVGNKQTRVDVIWQDGTRTYGVDSTTLITIKDAGDHDFFPEEYVVEKGSDDDDGDASESRRRVGIVKNVDSKERIARVRWLKAVDCPQDTLKFDGEESVSVYELAYHPHYNYVVAGIVIRPHSPVFGEADQVLGIVDQLGDHIESRDEIGHKNVVETADLSTNQKALKKTQKAEVDKNIEESYLSCIGSVIGVKDGYIEVAWADGTVSKMAPPRQTCLVHSDDEEEEDKDETAEEDDMEQRNEKNAVLHIGMEQTNEENTALDIDMEQTNEENTALDIDIEQTNEENTVHSLSSSSCHEPDTIFVRIYEDRMDLLRAVIVGAAGTPYQDGLFFFDIRFPSEYPDIPPLAYYHSGGLRLNPNLYKNGKVCLSLLNTWTGKGNEVWNPLSSTVLQLLVSIQGLVLNDNPYFNEPGFEKQIGSAIGEKNSLAYKESSFLLSCKSMLYVLRKPPKHFEMFVKEHFQKRGHCILRACDAYIKGAPVGSLSEDSTIVGEETENPGATSAGFKLILLKIVPKLIAAFTEIGVDCQEFQ